MAKKNNFNDRQFLKEVSPEDRGERGVKSVEGSNTQFSELCQLQTPVIEFQKTAERLAKLEKTLPLRIRYIIWIMLNSGCRISEVLNLQQKDVSQMNDIFITALKYGENRIVRIPVLSNKYIYELSKSDYIFSDYDRFYIYRVCKRYGLYFKKDGLQVQSVTHSFRAAYAQSILTISEKSKTTAHALGHKRVNTIDYYAKNIKK